MLEKIIIDKIERDSSYNFTLKEIKTYSKECGYQFDEFASQVLKLNASQIKSLIDGKSSYVKCVHFQKLKQQFLEENKTIYLRKILDIKVKTSNLNNFNLEELETYSRILKINTKDLAVKIMDIDISNYYQLLEGNYLAVASTPYKKLKTIYMSSIKEKLLEKILKERLNSGDYSNRFTIGDIEYFSKKNGINSSDFSEYILGIKQAYKDISSDGQSKFLSPNFKLFKEQYLKSNPEIKESNKKEKNTASYISQKKDTRLDNIANMLDIPLYDLVTIALLKTDTMYADIINKSSLYSTHDECKILRENVHSLLEIVWKSVDKGLIFLSANGCKCEKYVIDLFKDTYFFVIGEVSMQCYINREDFERDKASLYKKAHVRVLNDIKKIYSLEISGKMCPRIEGVNFDIVDYTSLILSLLSNDEKSYKVLLDVAKSENLSDEYEKEYIRDLILSIKDFYVNEENFVI